MGNESLSKQSLEKLETMSRKEKIKLFNRLRIIELNKVIGAILVNAVGEAELRKTKAKLIHHIYDKNSKREDRYRELQLVLDGGKNLYDQLDSYTTAAYANYYVLFAKHAIDAKSYRAIESAMFKAFNEVQACVNTNELKIDCANKIKAIPSVLLESKYRKAVIDYLEEDLQTRFNVKKIIVFDDEQKQSVQHKNVAEEETSHHLRPLRKAMNLEKYTGLNGEEFYLDADGEFYTPDEVT